MSYSKTIIEHVGLPDGAALVVYGFNGDMNSIPDEEHYCNIELLREGKVIWKVAAMGKSHSSFSGINVFGGKYEAVNFEGIVYSLDVATGNIERVGWTK